jgi:tetratricopeptide (TPR) repeat protein
MRRILFSAIGFLVLAWLLMQWGVLPAPVARVLWPIVNLAWGLACPLFFLSLWIAPGIYQETVDDLRQFRERLGARRNEVEELERKVATLDKPHHMLQLGSLYLRQGRVARAIPLLEKALEREPDTTEAQYRLGIAYLERHRCNEAATLLEKVHAATPAYDYGSAYLRLAEAQTRLGNCARAREIYEAMLKFYPGQPECCYQLGLLLGRDGERERAVKMMREVIFTLRHSPRFQRRRNGHWGLKARWWLWRHG